jgi:hypothetical protein
MLKWTEPRHPKPTVKSRRPLVKDTVVIDISSDSDDGDVDIDVDGDVDCDGDESSTSDHSPHVRTGSPFQGGALSPLKRGFNQLTGK